MVIHDFTMVRTCPLVWMKLFILMFYIRQWSAEPENVITADSQGKQTSLFYVKETLGLNKLYIIGKAILGMNKSYRICCASWLIIAPSAPGFKGWISLYNSTSGKMSWRHQLVRNQAKTLWIVQLSWGICHRAVPRTFS